MNVMDKTPSYFVKRGRLYFYVGILLGTLALADVLLWWSIATSGISFVKAKDTYLNHYPSFLQSTGTITLLGIAESAVSIYLLTTARLSGMGSRGIYAIVYVLFGALNSVMILWRLFTLL